MYVLTGVQCGHHVKNAKATAGVGRNGSELLENCEDRTLDGSESDIRDDERPFGGLEFTEEKRGVGNDANAPAFRVKNLANGIGSGSVVVEHKNTDLTLRDWLRRGRHFRSIAPVAAVRRRNGVPRA